MNIADDNKHHSLALQIRATLAVISVFILMSHSLAHAESVPPEQTTASTPKYEVPEILTKSGIYDYDISWQGIPVASAQISVQRFPNDEMHVKSVVQSVRGIRWLYSLRHVSEALFKTTPFTPIRFSSRQLENRRSKYRTIDYDGLGKLRARDWRGGKTGETFQLDTHNQTLDPYAAAVLAMSLPISEGKTAEFDVFNGRHRFVIRLQTGKEEVLELDEGNVKAFQVTPTIQKLTDTKGEDRFKGATIWFRGGNDRQIVKMVSKVWIGSIRAELVRYRSEVKTEDPATVRKRIMNPESQTTFD